MNKRLRSISGSWYVWLFPVIAVALTTWLIVDYYRQQGPTIRIYFDDAAGIQAEKTTVRFRGVAIGTVRKILISDDRKDVIAEVELRREARNFAVAGSKFALIMPKINFQGISGLETLFDGTYIDVLPGSVNGEEKLTFKAQTTTTATDPLDDTSAYLLETDNAESVSTGDSVTFRGVKVGSVTKLIMATDGRSVFAQINIENKYVRLVRSNTVFWRKSGVQAKLGLFNSEIKINSLDAIMNGGVEFATPNEAGAQAKALHKFKLEGNAPKDSGKWNPKLDGGAISRAEAKTEVRDNAI